jgi:hypothetical protein
VVFDAVTRSVLLPVNQDRLTSQRIEDHGGSAFQEENGTGRNYWNNTGTGQPGFTQRAQMVQKPAFDAE